jgi:hypothetical protein
MKSEFIPITVVDNFFKDPNEIRKIALSADYGIKSNNPGFRSDQLQLLNPNLYSLIAKKIFSLFLNLEKDVIEYHIDMSFQYTTKDFDYGWVHFDSSAYCAGVIYLTPNPPENTGTIIYDQINSLKNYSELQTIKEDFYKNRIKHQDYDKAREKNNANFKKNIVIENIYNRALIYPSNYAHSENCFFGETKENARLTLVFFLKTVAASSLFPIDRFNKVAI